MTQPADVQPFSGFPSQTDATPVPASFFSEVLPDIDDILELKLFLVALRRIKRRKGSIRWVLESELLAAPELSRTPSGPQSPDAGHTTEQAHQALDRAMRRGLLVAVALGEHPMGARPESAYFLNDPEGRRSAELVRTGAASVGTPPAPPILDDGMPGPTRAVANIFRLYEDTIGTIGGAGIADQLVEAEAHYPADWIAEAFHEAAAQNVRRWAYVRAILARWQEEGRSTTNGTTERSAAKSRYRTGKYGGVVRWK